MTESCLEHFSDARQEQTDKKIAIIENEFGEACPFLSSSWEKLKCTEVPIDDALLKQEKLALAEKVPAVHTCAVSIWLWVKTNGTILG